MKPEPVTAPATCSLCHQPWAKHPANPTAEDCVRVLLDALAAERRPVVAPMPVMPYTPPPSPYPTVVPYVPYRVTTTDRVDFDFCAGTVTPPSIEMVGSPSPPSVR